MNSSDESAAAGGAQASSHDDDRLRDEARARLAAIVESSDDAIVSKTLEGIIRTWNAGAQRIFGYTAEEVIGKPINILIPPDRQEEEPKILARLRRGERVDHFETVRVTKDGRLLELSVTISPVRDTTGRVIGASKIARDITRQKQIERELREAKEAAEAASRAKDHFLSMLSHELRTPLTPVLASMGYLETRGDLPMELREELAMLRRNIETEARLVDDLLDLTRISRGKLELHLEVVDAHAAVRDAAEVFRDAMDEKRIEFSTSLHAREHFVWADPNRLGQIFLNLLSNAVKFTPSGGRISIHSEGSTGEFSIEIRDTGAGMEPSMISRLFNPFEQGDAGTSRRFGGLGLGLAITRSLVDMLGGRISARSEGPGRGSSFRVTFTHVPASRQHESVPAVSIMPTLSMRVLLVEDHSDTRRVMSKLLTTFGCTVYTAGTVAEAIAIADANEFDVLVSDIGLPDGSGADIMRYVKQRRNIKGVAVSGFGQPDDHRRSHDAGFDAHLTKPVNLNTLQEALKKVAG